MLNIPDMIYHQKHHITLLSFICSNLNPGLIIRNYSLVAFEMTGSNICDSISGLLRTYGKMEGGGVRILNPLSMYVYVFASLPGNLI